MKLTPVLFASALVLLGIAPVSAHDQLRVIGTITKPDQDTLEVKTRDGQIVTIRLDNGTFISRDRKKAEFAELRAGSNVVIDAWGDSLDDAVALEVRIVPSITAPASK
jgi:hypothetical protein